MDAVESLPTYFPSQPTPSYTNEPRPDEECLAITSRESERARPPRGVFRVSSKSSRNAVTLELENQEVNATIPCFDRDAVVRGRIILRSREKVQRVVVELEGQLKLSIAEGGNKSRPLFRIAHVIWKRGSQTTQCPQTLEFVVPLPNSYTSGSRSRPLPPSYQIVFPGVPGLYANTSYTITIHISRAWKLLPKPLLTLSTPMKYYPRTTAPRVIKNIHPFFSLIKTAPEEYHQVVSAMRTRSGSGFAPIHCLLFIPSTCIYAIDDEIPFHIQLIAPLSSLLAFTQPQPCNGHVRSSTTSQLPSEQQTTEHMDSNTLVRRSSSASVSIDRNNISNISMGISRSRRSTSSRYSIRVFLLRQIIVEVRGQRAWRTCVLGEGSISPSPPGHSPPSTYPYQSSPQSFHHYERSTSSSPHNLPMASTRRPNVYSRISELSGYVFGSALSSKNSTSSTDGRGDPSIDPIESLDWDGMVRVKNPSEIQTGGFATSSLVVKDFIVLELQPTEPAKNPFITLQHAHPIRLVTDTLEDTWA